MGDKDGAPLSDVAVSAKGCNGGAENNGNGAYSLSLSDFAKTLIFSYVGFTWKQVSISGKNEVNVVLAAAASHALDEIVVIGYGTSKKQF